MYKTISLFQNRTLPAYATLTRLNFPLLSIYILLHLTLLAAPFTFTWQGFILGLVLSFLTVCLGITLCYHRLLAHRSYQLSRPICVVFAFLGCLAFQRGPIWWVACHRLHHQRVDKPGDPHSPSNSFLWSHFLWPFFKHPQLDDASEALQKLAPDLYFDPAFRFLETHYTTINILFLGLLFLIGYFLNGINLGLSFLFWGGFFRIIYGLNITWLVNSAAHLWGYQRFETPDKSRNNWWVALLTYGEGWHNNHHAQPRSAKMGFTWYELDVTYYIIFTLKSLGLAKRVIGFKQISRATS
jgi:fatty-acid desaturase